MIGDVTGRGAEAASITALARYTLRTAAVLTNDPAGRPGHPQPGAARPRRHLAVQHRRAGAERRSAATGADGGRRPPPPLLVDGEAVREVGRAPTRCSAPSPTSSGRSSETPVEPGQQLVMITDGIIEAAGARGSLRRGAAAGRACRSRTTRPAPCSGSKARCTASPPARSTTTWRSWRSPARAASAPPARVSRCEGRPAERLRRHEALVGRLFNAFNQRDAV